MRTSDGVRRSSTETSAFRTAIEARNLSHDRSNYLSGYDWFARGTGRPPGKIGETFAEIVTHLVLGGQPRQQALLSHPVLGPPARQVIDFLDNGLDPEALIYDRATGESPASRIIADEDLPRYILLDGISWYVTALNINMTAARVKQLQDASVAELERIRDHLDAVGRWPE